MTEKPLRIACAANFAPLLEELREDWTAEGKAPFEIVRGATGTLATQIRQGAPFDLLLAADLARPAALVEAGLAWPAEPLVYGRGRLALVGATVPPEAEDAPASARLVRAFGSEAVRTVAIAEPRLAPYGRAALEVLEQPTVRAVFRGEVVRGANVAHAFAMAASGAADLGLVALAQARQDGTAALVVPASWHAPIDQGAVGLARGGRRKAVEAFLAWLVSPEVQARLVAVGYAEAGLR